MEVVRYVLVLVSIYLSIIEISGLSFSLSWGDFTFVFVLLMFVFDLFRGQIIFNRFSRFFLYYILLLIFSATLNGSLLMGPLLNILRTNIEGFVFFTYIFSLISRAKITKTIFFIGLLILFIAFSFNTLPQLKQMWASTGFTNYQIFESSLNLNTWGYVMYLFFFLALVSWLNGTFKLYSLLTAFIISVIMIFSFSRNVYVLSIVTLAWIVIYVLNINIKKLVIPIVLISVLFIFVDFQQLFNLKFIDAATDFWNNKSKTAQSDLIDTRFFLINIYPIQEIFSKFNVFKLFFGDAISVQHSFVAHSLIVTGLIGLFLFLYRFIYAFYFAIKVQKYISKRTAKLLMLFILIFLLNDFVTNTSVLLPISSYLSYVILGYLFAEIELSKRNRLRLLLKLRKSQGNQTVCQK